MTRLVWAEPKVSQVHHHDSSHSWLMTPTKTHPHKPMLTEWTSEVSLSLGFRANMEGQLKSVWARGQLPPRGPSYARALRGFCAPVS